MKKNWPFYDILTRWENNYDSVKHITPKYCAISQLIINDIENGILQNGDRLPPHRRVADTLGVSIQTISSAYRELEHQGYMNARVGNGSFVFKQVTTETSKFIRDHRESGITDLSVIRTVYTEQHDQYIAQIFEQLAEHKQKHNAQYTFMRSCRPVAGLEHHREIISQYVSDYLPQAHTDNVMMTNGASQGIFLALASILRPDDTVVTEQLTDHGVIGCSRLLRYSLKGGQCDEHGIIPEHFEYLCQHENVKALVCTPHLNNPTSVTMPLQRREEIAAIAEKYQVFIIEDDVYRELLEQPITPISALLPKQSFYITSFTKSAITGLRTGFIICPDQYQLRLESILKVSNWMATPLLHEILCRWIEDGSLQQLVQLQRQLISERQALVKNILGKQIKQHNPESLSCWIPLPENWEPMSFTKRLYEQHIAVSTPDPFVVESEAYINAVRVCIGADINLDEFENALMTIIALLDNQPTISSAWY